MPPFAYLDPFSSIFDLHKPPASGSAVLLVQFIDQPVAASVSPPPGFVDAFENRWDGETFIVLVPELATLTSTQKARLIQPYYYTTGFGWGAQGPSGYTYSATWAEAIAYAIGVPVGDIAVKASLGAAVFVRTELSELIISSIVHTRNDYNWSDMPMYTASALGGSMVWDNAIPSPAAFDTIYRPLTVQLADSNSLLLANQYGRVVWNPLATIEDYLESATGTFVTPASVTGETQYNSQRAANIANEGSVIYP